MARSLARGLRILTALNRRATATVADLEQALDIPRATIYRIMAVLMSEGFVYKHRSDGRFRLARRARELSEGSPTRSTSRSPCPETRPPGALTLRCARAAAKLAVAVRRFVPVARKADWITQ